jgi:hypothetical protein
MVNKRYQPAPVQYFTCGKCKKLITDPDFISHFKSCTGKPKEQPIQEDVKG